MNTFKASDSLTRPANTTAYAAGDVWTNGSNARLNFTGMPSPAGSGFLINSALCIDDGNQATKPDLELYLFDTDITDLDADNATWTPTDAQLQTLVGVIAFPVASFKGGDLTSGAGGNCVCWVNNVAVTCTPTTASSFTLYGVVVVRNAYTPLSGESLKFVLNVIR